MISAFPVDYFDRVIEERTDEHILKGLECCANYADCDSCPYDPLDEDCALLVLKDSLGFIKRLKEDLTEEKRENTIYFELTNYLAGKITCVDCEIKDMCLQLKIYKKKDINKKEDVAGCWAMWYKVIEEILEEDKVIKKRDSEDKIRKAKERAAKRIAEKKESAQ